MVFFRYSSCFSHAALALLALSLVAGCGNATKLVVTPETDDHQYQSGEEMLKENRPDDALAAFQNVIKAREDDAPESHLEAGLLLLNVKNDPIGAIYHFQKYLVAQPNSEQAPRVKQLIETAEKNFARSLPMHPDSAYDEADLLDQIKTLQAENENLRQQLAGSSGFRAASGLPPGNSPATVTPVTPIANPAPPAPRAPVQVTATPVASVTPSPAASPNTYTVKDHDTLMSISQTLYGTRSRWQDIYNANRDKLPSPESLHVGQVLNLPRK